MVQGCPYGYRRKSADGNSAPRCQSKDSSRVHNDAHRVLGPGLKPQVSLGGSWAPSTAIAAYPNHWARTSHSHSFMLKKKIPT